MAEDGKSFQKAMAELAGDKRVSIKIGVQIPEARGGDDFFLEFDPTVTAMVEDHRWLFPYAAWTESLRELPFHVHKRQWSVSVKDLRAACCL